MSSFLCRGAVTHEQKCYQSNCLIMWTQYCQPSKLVVLTYPGLMLLYPGAISQHDDGPSWGHPLCDWDCWP